MFANLQALEFVEDAIALVEPAQLKLVFWNNAFSAWAHMHGQSASLEEIFPQISVEKMMARLEQKKRYAFETDAHPEGKRSFPVEYTIQHRTVTGQDVFWVHGRDISKAHAKDLMLKTFTKLVEVNNRKLAHEKKKVEALLDNMRQAVFSVSRGGKVVDPVSQYAGTRFNGSISGLAVLETVYRLCDAEEVSLIDTTLNCIFGADELQWEFMQDNLPARVHYIAPQYDSCSEDEK